jgi:hypothetical protein
VETVLVACQTIEDEIQAGLERFSLSYPIIWLEGGLHNSPDKLRKRVQEILDSVQCQRLLIALGYCGGGVSGLSTGNFQTVLPLADDCLSLLLGSMEARRLASRPATYFLTAGWMRHENNLVTTYHHAVERFGKRQADRINQLMFKHYRRIGLVQTGCYDPQEVNVQVEPLADTLGLTIETLPGDNDWLGGFLTGPHTDRERFLVAAPHSVISFEAWSKLLMGTESSSQVTQFDSAPVFPAVPTLLSPPRGGRPVEGV